MKTNKIFKFATSVLISLSMLFSSTVQAIDYQNEKQKEMRDEMDKDKGEMAKSGGVKNQSDSVGKKDGAKSGMNAAIGAMLIAMCIAMKNPALCAMGAMALMQAGKDKGHKGDAGQTANTAFNGGGVKDSAPTKTAKKRVVDGTGLSPGEERKLDDAIAMLKENGYGVDKASGKVTAPDGSAVSGSAFGSAGGLDKLGLSDEQKQQVKEAMGKVNDMAANMKLETAGGGKGKGPDIKPSDLDLSMFAVPETLVAEAPKGDGSLAGYSRNFMGDQIGVIGDDLFQMVHRRYRAKERANNFLP